MTTKNFCLSGFQFDIKGDAFITINGETYTSRFYRVNPDKLLQLTVQDIKDIAYDITNHFYNPNIIERALSINESIQLRDEIIKHMVIYLLS